MNEEQFGKGGVPDKFDSRDFKYSDVAAARGSAPFDWDVGFDIETVLQATLGDLNFRLPVKNQGGSSSCGGQAWSSYQSVLEALASKTFEERSAKYVYAQTFVPGGGSYGRDNCNICIKQGVSREIMLSSYENNVSPSEAFMERPQDVTQTARDDAATDRDLSYAGVGTSIDEVAQAIRDNGGVVLGIKGTNNGTWLTPFPQHPNTGDALWGHWVYAGKAKMINGKKHIGILNSWGNIGEFGWQWLSEDYFTSDWVFNTWTMVFFSIPTSLKHTFNSNLWYGCEVFSAGYRQEVVFLQTALLLDGEFPLAKFVPENLGYFGPTTFNAVKAFQSKYNINPTSGFVGNLTRSKLNQLYS